MYGVQKTQDEIDEVLNQVYEAIDQGERRFPGMSYEQGVEAALEWVIGNRDEDPYPEE